MNHWHTKLLVSCLVLTVAITASYDISSLEEFGPEASLVAAAVPPIQPGLTLPPAPQPMTLPLTEPLATPVVVPAQPMTLPIAPAVPMAAPEIHPAMPHIEQVTTPISAPVVQPAAVPQPPTPIAEPVITPPAHPDTPVMAKPAESTEHHGKHAAAQPQSAAEIKHEAQDKDDERIKLLVEQLAQLEQKITAFDARLRAAEQLVHKTDGQLTALVNELEAPAPEEDELTFGTAPSMEPAANKKAQSSLPLLDDEDDEEEDEVGRKL